MPTRGSKEASGPEADSWTPRAWKTSIRSKEDFKERCIQGVVLIFDQLKRDHDKLRLLLKRMETLGPKALATRKELLKEFVEIFQAHNRAEELFFYRAILRGEYGSDLTHDQALESLEDHTTLTYALNEIEDTDVRDNAWSERLRFFKRAVERHFIEEEKVLFKQARSLVTRTQAQELGEAAQELMNELTVRVSTKEI